MKIGIIGAGAVGLLMGVYFQSKYNVTMYTRSFDQATLIKQKGVELTCENTVKVIEVDASGHYLHIDEQDFIIIAVKQYDLLGLIPILQQLPNHIPILFIQNGMGHLQLLEKLSQSKIFLGTVEHGVLKTSPRTIVHTGIGKINIAIFRGDTKEFDLFPTIKQVNFPILFQNDYRVMLEKKLLANALINPLTAMLNVKNGQLLENPFYYEILLDIYKEIFPLFSGLHYDETLREIESICKSTKDNTSSMLKDIKQGRKTEVDAILGYIIDRAQLKGYPLERIRLIYNVIKGFEEEGGQYI